MPDGLGATVWIVVRVVVRERTDGAGEEKVLSPPLRPLAVRLVPAREDSPIMERHGSCSVDIECPPVVGGCCSSLDRRTEPSRSRDVVLVNRRLGPEDME